MNIRYPIYEGVYRILTFVTSLMSLITNICNLPTEGNSNAKLLYFFFEL